MTRLSLQITLIYLAIILDLILIRVIFNDPGFGPRSMAYLSVMSSAIPIDLQIPTAILYQSVRRQRNNPPTFIQSILFWLMEFRMGLMANLRLLVIRTSLIQSNMLMISYNIFEPSPVYSFWYQFPEVDTRISIIYD